MSDELIATPATLSKREADYRVAELLEIVEQLKQDFADRDALYRDIDAVIFNELQVEIPDAYRKTAIEVRSPLAAHIVSTVTAALTVNHPTVQFQPIGFGTQHEENATLREHFFEASFRRQEEEARRRLFRSFMYSLVAKGEAVLKTIERTKTAWAQYDAFSRQLVRKLEEDPQYRHLDWDAKSRVYDKLTEEKKLQLPYPITTTDVLPDCFYYIKGENGFTLCVEVQQVPYYETLARYQMGLDSRGYVVPQAAALPRPQWKQVMGKARTLTLTEVWDWQQVHYILQGPGQDKGGTLVKQVKHGYGEPVTRTLRGPYFHALGVSTSSRLPDRAGLGVLYGFLPLFPLLNSLLTIESQIAYIYGWPTFKRRAPDGATMPMPFGHDGSEREIEQIEPGTIYPYDIEPVQPPRGSEHIDKMIGLVRNMLELALPSVVQGVVSGDESGYALNQAAYLARLAWDPIVDNAEFALSERVGFESWLIENCIMEPVHVWHEQVTTRRRKSRAGYLSIGPDDLRGVHRYRVRLDPETPSNKVIELRYHDLALAKQLERWEDAVEALGGNPDEVEKAWLLKELKNDPAIKEELRRRILQRVATIEEKRVESAERRMGEPLMGGPAQAGLGNIGQVFQPGQTMPIQPTPQGAVTGVGPMGRALAQGGGGGPVTPNAPPQHIPLPGEQG